MRQERSIYPECRNWRATAAAWVGPTEIASLSRDGVRRLGKFPANGDWHRLSQVWFARPPRYFGRFPTAAKAACGVACMLMQDADPQWKPELKSEIGLLGVGLEPTREVNFEYFRDYVAAGRSLARGNLFVYTLPTAALAEASIACGLAGPSWFMQAERQPFAALLQAAGQELRSGRAQAILALWLSTAGAAGVRLDRGQRDSEDVAGIVEPKALLEAAAEWSEIDEMIGYFTTRKPL